MVRDNAVIILQALLMGLEVEIGERRYCLGVTDDSEHLCVIGQSENTQTGEKKKVLLGVWSEWSLATYLAICQDVTDDQIAVIAAEIALNE